MMLTYPGKDGLAAAVLYNHLNHAGEGEKEVWSRFAADKSACCENGKHYLA